MAGLVLCVQPLEVAQGHFIKTVQFCSLPKRVRGNGNPQRPGSAVHLDNHGANPLIRRRGVALLDPHAFANSEERHGMPLVLQSEFTNDQIQENGHLPREIDKCRSFRRGAGIAQL